MQKTHANHVKRRLDGHFGSSDGFEKTHAKTHMSGGCRPKEPLLQIVGCDWQGLGTPQRGRKLGAIWSFWPNLQNNNSLNLWFLRTKPKYHIKIIQYVI